MTAYRPVCASFAGLVLCFIARFIILVIAPLRRLTGDREIASSVPRFPASAFPSSPMTSERNQHRGGEARGVARNLFWGGVQFWGRYKTFSTHCGVSSMAVLTQFLLLKKFTWPDVGRVYTDIPPVVMPLARPKVPKFNAENGERES